MEGEREEEEEEEAEEEVIERSVSCSSSNRGDSVLKDLLNMISRGRWW